MTKLQLLTKLERIREDSEAFEFPENIPCQLLDVLLDYIGDVDVRTKIDEVVF